MSLLFVRAFLVPLFPSAMNHFRPIHKIFLLDGTLEDLIDEKNPQEFARHYFTELLEAIDMQPLAPMSVSPAADLKAPGFSGIQELTTSHTSFHYFWEPGIDDPHPNIHIDLYSCAPFSYNDVIRIAHKHFRFQSWIANCIDRHLESSQRMTIQLTGTHDRILHKTPLLLHSRQNALV